MRKIFSHENRLIVFNLLNLLESRGVSCELRNEFAGSGVGDLSPFETWPELWVDETDVARAEAVLQGLDQSSQQEWLCADCGAENAGNFNLCWQCGRMKDTVDIPQPGGQSA